MEKKERMERKLGTWADFLKHSLFNFSHLNLTKSTAIQGICRFPPVVAFRLRNVFGRMQLEFVLGCVSLKSHSASSFSPNPFSFYPSSSQGSSLILAFVWHQYFVLDVWALVVGMQTRPPVPICHCPPGIPEASGPPGPAALSGEARPLRRGSGVWKPVPTAPHRSLAPLLPKEDGGGWWSTKAARRFCSLKSQPIS